LPTHGRLAAALWLDAQRPVWVRTAAATEAGRLAGEARLQAALALPGVAPVVEDGVASGIPYVAVSGVGRPLVIDGTALDTPVAFVLATTGARVLRALALAGAMLPDVESERFLFAPPTGLLLADLDGVPPAESVAAPSAHAPLAHRFAVRVLAAAGERGVPADEATDLVRLVAALDAAALRLRR